MFLWVLVLLFSVVAVAPQGSDCPDDPNIDLKGLVLKMIKFGASNSDLLRLMNGYVYVKRMDGVTRRLQYDNGVYQAVAFILRFCRLNRRDHCVDMVVVIDLTKGIATYGRFIGAAMVKPLKRDEDLRYAVKQTPYGFLFVYDDGTCEERELNLQAGHYVEVKDSACEKVELYGYAQSDFTEEKVIIDNFNAYVEQLNFNKAPQRYNGDYGGMTAEDYEQHVHNRHSDLMTSAGQGNQYY